MSAPAFIHNAHLYLALLPRQTWQLFLLLPPAEAIVLLSWRLAVRMKKR